MPTNATDTTRGLTTRGVCEITLESADHERLAGFYRELLDLPLLSEDNDRIWLGCGPQARLGLWSPGEKEFGDRGGHHVHFALSVSSDGMHGAVRRLRGIGHDFRGPVEHEGGDHSLYFEDLEGNVVELWDFFEEGDGSRDGIDAL